MRNVFHAVFCGFYIFSPLPMQLCRCFDFFGYVDLGSKPWTLYEVRAASYDLGCDQKRMEDLIEGKQSGFVPPFFVQPLSLAVCRANEMPVSNVRWRFDEAVIHILQKYIL